jgi:hypothetical protein
MLIIFINLKRKTKLWTMAIQRKRDANACMHTCMLNQLSKMESASAQEYVLQSSVYIGMDLCHANASLHSKSYLAFNGKHLI